MGKENQGIRDGSGPFKGSYQNTYNNNNNVGKKQQAGKTCPNNSNKHTSYLNKLGIKVYK